MLYPINADGYPLPGIESRGCVNDFYMRVHSAIFQSSESQAFISTPLMLL